MTSFTDFLNSQTYKNYEIQQNSLVKIDFL